MLKMQDLSHLACGFGREVLTDHPTLGYSLYVFKGEARAELFPVLAGKSRAGRRQPLQ